MKLNLGSGEDVRPGYVNVDFRDIPGVLKVDLSSFPWPWPDGSVDEVMALDFVEHFSYLKTERLLQEIWRVLKPCGKLEVQVPDLEECARAACEIPPFLCNMCGFEFREKSEKCSQCGRSTRDISASAIQRMYGGQDFMGNTHLAGFTIKTMTRLLRDVGFEPFSLEAKNEKGETHRQNWNFKIVSLKSDDMWGDAP